MGIIINISSSVSVHVAIHCLTIQEKDMPRVLIIMGIFPLSVNNRNSMLLKHQNTKSMSHTKDPFSSTCNTCAYILNLPESYNSLAMEMSGATYRGQFTGRPGAINSMIPLTKCHDSQDLPSRKNF